MPSYIDDPNWLPHSYDAARGEIVFAHIPREEHRKIGFLDNRIGDRPRSPPIRISAAELAQAPAGPIHFIFHTASCCSTLMTSALDAPGVSMGLKEPGVLLTFRQRWAPDNPAAHEALNTILHLLSRPFGENETQIVKPSNGVNYITEHALNARPQAKMLLMHSDLATFLRAIVRGDLIARLSVRELFAGLAPFLPLRVMPTAQELGLLADLQVAAYAWLMQAAHFAALEKKYPERVRTLSAGAFTANPTDTLRRVASFFNLPPHDWNAVANSAIFKTYAKDPAKSYDAEADRKKRESAPGYDQEIAQAVRWSGGLAKMCGVATELGDSLLAH